MYLLFGGGLSRSNTSTDARVPPPPGRQLGFQRTWLVASQAIADWRAIEAVLAGGQWLSANVSFFNDRFPHAP
jgi:hypothetical protein